MKKFPVLILTAVLILAGCSQDPVFDDLVNQLDTTITYVVDGQETLVKAAVSAPLAEEPSKEGYDFIGWALDESGTQMYTDWGDALDSGLRLYAIFRLSGADVWDGSVDTSWYDAENPRTGYEIATAEQLAGLAQLVNEGASFKGVTFTLVEDIDLADRAWTPIGSLVSNTGNPYGEDESFFHVFSGSFDGQGHKISNLNIPQERLSANFTNSYIGLFGVVSAEDNAIFNLTIENVAIEGNSFGGALVGYIPNDGDASNQSVTISNVDITGDIQIDMGSNAGGLLGRVETRSQLTIEECSVAGDEGSFISATGDRGTTSFAGGMVGAAYSNTSNVFNNVSVSGLDVTGELEAVGGLAGLIGKGEVSGLTVNDVDLSITYVNPSYPNDNKAMGAVAGHIYGTPDSGAVHLTLSDMSFSDVSLNFAIMEFTPFCQGLVGTFRSDSYEMTDPSSIISGIPEAVTGVSLVFASEWKGNAETSWYDNAPEGVSEFQLSTEAQLAGLAELVNGGESFAGKTISLAGDLDVSGYEWTPIGNAVRNSASLVGTPFSGVFDGNGHTIKCLTINGDDFDNDSALGLFGAVSGSSAVVRNLVLMDVAINAPSNGNTAGIAGVLADGAEIDGVSVTGDSSIIAEEAGGIVGRIISSGTVSDCINHADVTSTRDNGKGGGIAMVAYYTVDGSSIQITGCTNHGDVTVSTGSGAGIVGYVDDHVRVSGSTNNGTITAKYAGGIIGYGSVPEDAAIEACTNNGGINASTNAGGIAGIITGGSDSTVRDCVNNGPVSAITETASSGGVIGSLSYWTIEDCENHGSVLGGRFAGGLVGELGGKAVIKSSDGGDADTSISTIAETSLVRGDVKGLSGHLIGAVRNSPDIETRSELQIMEDDEHGDLKTIGAMGPDTAWAGLHITSGTLIGIPDIGQGPGQIEFATEASWDSMDAAGGKIYRLTRASGDDYEVNVTESEWYGNK